MCSDCQIRVKDQLFCSKRCNTLFRIKNFRLRTQQAIFKHNLYLRSKIDRLNKYSTFLLILVSLGAGLILLYSATTEERHTSKVFPAQNLAANASVNTQGSDDSKSGNKNPLALVFQVAHPLSPLAMNNTLSTPNNAGLSLKNTLAAQGAGSIPSDSIEQMCADFQISLAPHRAQQPSYIIDICGNAPPNSIIALYKNDRLCDTVPCRGTRFLFPRIGLEKNKNMLQAKLITANGNLCYSNTLELIVDVATSQVVEKGLDFRRGNTNQAKICLSFDSGESADEATHILDILREKQVQTTIFLTGEFIRRNTKIVRRIVAEGHEVGNHTDTHPHLTRIDDSEIKCRPGVNREFLHHELKKTEGAFYYLTGKHMSPYWRAPYGESNLEIRKWAEEIGYVHVSWTCGRDWENGLDSLDWVANTDSIKYHTAEEIRDQIINFGNDTEVGANGGIVLMHFSTSRPRQDEVYLQLPDIIDGLREKGYEIVKISQLLQEMSDQKHSGGAKKGRMRHARVENANRLLKKRMR